MSIDTAVVYAALTVGALMLTAVSYNFLRSGVVNRGGIALSSFGFMLMGLSVWSQVSFKANKDGIEFALRSIAEVASNVENISNTVEKQVAKNNKPSQSRSLAFQPSIQPSIDGHNKSKVDAINKDIKHLLNKKENFQQTSTIYKGPFGMVFEDSVGSAIKSSQIALMQAQIAVKKAELASLLN